MVGKTVTASPADSRKKHSSSPLLVQLLPLLFPSSFVPEGLLESRPAIYRRYWVLEFDLVPQGRLKLRFTDGRYIRSTFTVFLALKIANRCWLVKSRNDFGCSWERKAKRNKTAAEHHRLKSFQEEYVIFLKKHGIRFEGRYLWD
jgi:hypothetical protein